MAFFHGISVTETSDTSTTLATVATAIIGLVATGPAADAATFPLDKPVAIGTSGGIVMKDAIAAAGATGTLKLALQAIAAVVRAPVVVVRVAPGADDEATDAAIIGTDVNGAKTGIQALLAAEGQLGIRPRIIGAPGLESEDVTAALATVAARLRAMAYAGAIGADRQAVAAYRAKFDQRELMLIWPNVVAPLGADDADVIVPAAAYALGMRALIDQEQGWHKTLSNVVVPGVTGLSADVQFDLQDADCDANILNGVGVTTLVRLNGDLRFWGNRTCADLDDDFTFESATRTAQILADTIVDGMIWAIDKPLLPSLARDIVEKLNGKFASLKTGGYILGAAASFNGDDNPAADLKAGKLRITYKYTPVPPLENLGFVQEITDEYFADFASLVSNG